MSKLRWDAVIEPGQSIIDPLHVVVNGKMLSTYVRASYQIIEWEQRPWPKPVLLQSWQVDETTMGFRFAPFSAPADVFVEQLTLSFNPEVPFRNNGVVSVLIHRPPAFVNSLDRFVICYPNLHEPGYGLPSYRWQGRPFVQQRGTPWPI
jgi:hypothetical protein